MYILCTFLKKTFQDINANLYQCGFTNVRGAKQCPPLSLLTYISFPN